MTFQQLQWRAQPNPCKMNRLKKIYEISPNKTTNLYFVVPSEIFKKFKLQKYVNEQNITASKIPKNVQKIVQFALEINLSTSISCSSETLKIDF